MSSQQIKEVNDAKEKWNKEGAPEESQAKYESQPKNVKKNFSVSSNGIKEWSKVELYLNSKDDKVKEVEDDNRLPEGVLDDEGYAKLCFSHLHIIPPLFLSWTLTHISLHTLLSSASALHDSA
ncbi:hypothetical protein BDR06DRAFT_1003575 [Suillus hirtellus]|nr:hypothetical protein BDR06DRAFT_1003575 [Suillus hirtellus]